MEVASDVVAPDETMSLCRRRWPCRGGQGLQPTPSCPFHSTRALQAVQPAETTASILLHGLPGTGKTLLARAVVREAKFTFIALNLARLLSKWYGESNKLADSYFSLAHKLAPSIIFIDEIDCLFRHRSGGGPAGGGGGDGEHEATAEGLPTMDGLLTSASSQVVVIAATNRPDSVDPAVLRRRRSRIALICLLSMVALTCCALLKDEPLAKEVDQQSRLLRRGTRAPTFTNCARLQRFDRWRRHSKWRPRREGDSANTPGGHAVANASVTKPAGCMVSAVAAILAANGKLVVAGTGRHRRQHRGRRGRNFSCNRDPPTEPRGPEPLISLRQLTRRLSGGERSAAYAAVSGVTHETCRAACTCAGGYDDELYD